MSSIDFHRVEHRRTKLTVEVAPSPRIHRQAAAAPVRLLDDDGLRIWTRSSAASTLLVRLVLAEPGLRWHKREDDAARAGGTTISR